MSCEYGRPNHESKPCAIGRNGRQVAEVPLADHAGGVAARLEQLGDRDLVGRQALGARCRAAPSAPRPPATPYMPAADRQAAGQERRPARRAHRLHVEAGPLLPRRRHGVEPRRADVRAAEGAEIAVAEVVGEDDDDVRRRGRGDLAPATGGGARRDERTERNPRPTSGFSMCASVRVADGYFAAIASTSSFQRGSSSRQQTTVEAGACPRRCFTRISTFASSSAGSAR